MRHPLPVPGTERWSSDECSRKMSMALALSSKHSSIGSRTASLAMSGPSVNALTAQGVALLFGLRLWASVCLALYVAFWLELDDPFWAGTSAAIVCQPQLGASLRKGWFRMIGTVVGAIAIVVLTACFPQDRVAFLLLLALWAAICGFVATLLRNFASYSAALAGYTAAIIAADTLGATGGPNTEVFMLAVTRASEICIGIVCAGIVLAGTDLGDAQRRLATSFAILAAEITSRFTNILAQPIPEVTETQAQLNELARRVIALDPEVDQAFGESSELRYHASTLQAAVYGVFTALDGYRGVVAHLRELPDKIARQGAQTILGKLPPQLRLSPEPAAPIRWIADPKGLHRVCEEAIRRLLALRARTPSLRLLADETVRLFTGILLVLDGLALLVGASGRSFSGQGRTRLMGADWLPALVNAGHIFVTIGLVEFVWIVTAWPNGAFAITFTAIVVLLLSPKGELAYAGALAFTLGTAVGIACTAIINFALLPGLETFPAFCIVIGLYLVPVGYWMAQTRQPAIFGMLTAMAIIFVPVLAPTNQMSYDPMQYYNLALAIFVACAAAALSFHLLPPLSPALQIRRLLAFALRDLRRVATARSPLQLDDWEERMYGRIAALPDKAGPIQGDDLLAVLAAGREILQLRRLSPFIRLEPELDAALAALAQGHSVIATTQLVQLDHRLASLPNKKPGVHLALRARASILVLSEALAQHADYFDAGRPA
jgi:uncharacterized membrane protein YccC